VVPAEVTCFGATVCELSVAQAASTQAVRTSIVREIRVRIIEIVDYVEEAE